MREAETAEVAFVNGIIEQANKLANDISHLRKKLESDGLSDSVTIKYKEIEKKLWVTLEKINENIDKTRKPKKLEDIETYLTNIKNLTKKGQAFVKQAQDLTDSRKFDVKGSTSLYDTINSFLKQTYSWATNSLDVHRKMNPLNLRAALEAAKAKEVKRESQVRDDKARGEVTDAERIGMSDITIQHQGLGAAVKQIDEEGKKLIDNSEELDYAKAIIQQVHEFSRELDRLNEKLEEYKRANVSIKESEDRSTEYDQARASIVATTEKMQSCLHNVSQGNNVEANLEKINELAKLGIEQVNRAQDITDIGYKQGQSTSNSTLGSISNALSNIKIWAAKTLGLYKKEPILLSKCLSELNATETRESPLYDSLAEAKIKGAGLDSAVDEVSKAAQSLPKPSH